MKKILLLLLLIPSVVFADDYMEITPSAYTYKDIYDELYLKLDCSNDPLTASLDIYGNVSAYDAGHTDYIRISHDGTSANVSSNIGNISILAPGTSDIALRLGDALGANKVSIQDSGNNEQASISSDGDFSTIGEYYAYNGANWGSFSHDGADAMLVSGMGDITLMTASDVNVLLSDAAGASYFRIQDSGVNTVASIDSNGLGTFPTINFGSSTGVSATATNGVLTLAGLFGTTENITLDLATANTVALKSTTGVSSLQIQLPTDSTTGFQVLDADGGTPILNVDTTNERVGIGTTSPRAKLTVAMTETDTVGSGHLEISNGATYAFQFRVGSSDMRSLNLDRYYSNWQTTPVMTWKRDTGNVGIGDTTAPTLLSLLKNSALTNTVQEMLRLTATSTGTVAANFGASLGTYLEDASGNAAQIASSIATIWTTATHGSESSAITFSGVAGGGAIAEIARFDNNSTAGNTRFMLYDVDNGTVERVSVGGADSGGAGYKVLRIPN